MKLIRDTLGALKERSGAAFIEFFPRSSDSLYARRDPFLDVEALDEDLRRDLVQVFDEQDFEHLSLLGISQALARCSGLAAFSRKRGLQNLLALKVETFNGEEGLLICGFDENRSVDSLLLVGMRAAARELALVLQIDDFRRGLDELRHQTDEFERGQRRLQKEMEHERHSLRREKDSALARVEEAQRLKNEFLSSVSHELRTPLNAIQGYTRIVLRDENLSERQRMSMERVLTSSRNQLKLINNILDYSRLEAGRMHVDLEQLDLAAVAREVVSQLQALADEQELELAVEFPEQGIHTVSDRAKVERVLINLLGNAIKFTPRGRVMLRIRTGGGMTVIEVEDSGIGIHPDEQELIFDHFRQGEGSHQRSHSGTGLGLAISRSLVNLLGGRIEVESTLGEGSVFRIQLPLFLDLSTARQALGLDEEEDFLSSPGSTSPPVTVSTEPGDREN